MRETRQFNVRIETKLFDRLKEHAKRTNASLSSIVQEALEECLDQADKEREAARQITRGAVVPTSPIRLPIVTGEVEHCERHPRAIVKDGECQTCRLEEQRA